MAPVEPVVIGAAALAASRRAMGVTCSSERKFPISATLRYTTDLSSSLG